MLDDCSIPVNNEQDVIAVKFFNIRKKCIAFLMRRQRLTIPINSICFISNFPVNLGGGVLDRVGRGSMLASTELVGDDRNRGVVSSGVRGTMC